MIAICPNPFRDTGCRLSLNAEELLKQHGYECCICPVFDDPSGSVILAGIKTERLADVAADCSLIIVVGGDGTILSAARQLRECSVPILGINLGSKGFMATLEPNELDHILDAAHGEYRLSRRMKIDVSLVRGGETIYTDCALNDAVIHGYGDCIKLTALCDGADITAFSGDGIILSTPTGSTGYSMSAGGPIVEPDAENIIISPICAHMMSSRCYVLGPEHEIEVHVEKLHGRRAYLSIDGNSVMDLANHDRIIIRRSASCTVMADMGLRNFYEIAFGKLR